MTVAARTSFVLAGAAIAVLALVASPAQAGFLAPAAWQSTGVESKHVMAVDGALAEALEAEGAKLPLTDAEREAMAAFYAARGNRSLWLGPAGLNDRAEALLKALREAPSYALPADDHAATIEAAEGLAPQADTARRARLEVDLTASALLYGRYASAGRVVPSTLGKSISYDPEAVDPAALLTKLAGDRPADEVLEGLHPHTEGYRALRAAFLELSRKSRDGSWTTVQSGPILKPGMSDPRVASLRARLIQAGELEADIVSDGSVYDAKLAEAVKAFQLRHGLADDGVVGPNTLAELNAPIEVRLRQIAASLERQRWLPDELGKTHVLVRLAEFEMNLIDRGEVIHAARVIVGKSSDQTPELANEINTVVFNPYWHVPRSIATNEYLPMLQRDPWAARRYGIQIFAPYRGRDAEVDPRRVDWRRITPRNFQFSLRQPPGRGNALGQIKFLFPNKHSVYMHDTPQRSLFSHYRRAFSHGCVRLQNPVDLAEILLGRDGWSRRAIERAIATGRNQHIKLQHTVPVYLVYWTAFADEDGHIQFRNDLYGRDQKVVEAVGVDGEALKMANLTLN